MPASTLTPTRVPVRNLRGRRVAAGLSQQALATAAGCSLTTIRSVEYGIAPSAAMAASIASALDAAGRDAREAAVA